MCVKIPVVTFGNKEESGQASKENDSTEIQIFTPCLVTNSVIFYTLIQKKAHIIYITYMQFFSRNLYLMKMPPLTKMQFKNVFC